MDYNDKEIINIILNDLHEIENFNPYRNFNNINNANQFKEFLSNDPAFNNIGLIDKKYVTARIGGNLVTSIHRKIGDMYENIFSHLIKTKFNLTEEHLNFNIKLNIDGKTQIRSTDGFIPIEKLKNIIEGDNLAGVAFEIRSCYQIGDSKRIQADYHMAESLLDKKILPIMLILCNSSLKSPVIRLKKIWKLYEGVESFNFIKKLTNFDLYKFMSNNRNIIEKPLKKVINQI